MELTFKHKTALVTGAGRGIGRAIAMQLAAEGLTVICVSRTEANSKSTAEAIQKAGGTAHALAVDVADKAAVQVASEALLKEFETIDIIVNNAGITRDNLMLRLKDEDWDDVINTNLSSCFHWVKSLLRPMTRNRWGRIINIASVVGITGNAGQANYAAAKAGMIGFSKSLARELASRSITSNVVAPGFVRSDMTAGLGEDISEEILKTVPLKRMGEPEEIANMVTYLASDQAAYITGQVFTVDGGMVM
ncbi:MAG TPA: 3-oxoacyl-ACP reductase [Opitutae bacterium]|nr:3-oxoacyl-ACP reductase [Opitutae bacterium]